MTPRPNSLHKRLLFALVSTLTGGLSAQTPFLVKDVNTTWSGPARSSMASSYVADGNAVYFTATVEGTGAEVWKVVDGQPSVAADVGPGSAGSDPANLVVLRPGLLLFTASTVETGRELWATDGSPAGTRLVKDVSPGVWGLSPPGIWFAFNGRAFLATSDGVHGVEPWVSDGTEAGTHMLLDLDGASTSSGVQWIAVFGERVLIFAGGGMWSTDGTTAGTLPIVAAGTLGDVRGFAQSGSVAYFTATAGAGRELWKTDGTAAGTVRVRDIAPGATSGVHSNAPLAAMGGRVYFIASTTGTTYDLWTSDGTEAGTQLVKAIVDEAIPGLPAPRPSLIAGEDLVYVGTNRGLWRSDGTAAGTYLLETNAAAAPFTSAFDGVYYFKVVDGFTELWKTNGTAATTRRIRRLPERTSLFRQNVGPPRFTGGKLYFTAQDPLHGVEPWVCGDAAATSVDLLANVNPDGVPSADVQNVTAAGDLAFFTAFDGWTTGQLWRSDGTASGTFRMTEAGTHSLFTAWQGTLYFRSAKTQLWRSDGSEAGTAMLKDLRPGVQADAISTFHPTTKFLYFGGDDGSGSALWRTDGTDAGTIKVTTGNASLTELAGRVYGSKSSTIFVTEGTPESTKQVAAFTGSGEMTTGLAAAAGALFFGRATTAAGNELWSSDGTTGSEMLVKDIRPGERSSTPRNLTGSGRYLFFVANDGTHGDELWRSDGTPEGTILLRDIWSGESSSWPRDLTRSGDVVYFVADDGVAGAELWRSDGSVAGTVPVADIRPGAASSDVQNLSASDGVLWFSADEGTHGRELWRTAAAGGVALVADLEPGPGSSTPGTAVRAGELLYFAATTSSFGRELWALTPGSEPAVAIADVRIQEGNSGTKTARFTLTRSGDVSAPSTVAFATVDASATAGSDYVAGSGSVAFEAGVTTRFIDVVVNGDASVEKNEAFLVTLTGATGAVLRNTAAVAVIENDDVRADLALEWVASYGSSSRRHVVRLVNHGPSPATDVVVRMSDSPGKVALSCGGQSGNPLNCTVPSLAAGASTEVSFTWQSSAVYTDPAEPPGTTVTADVRAAEPDAEPANNSVTRMVGARLELPPFLTNDTTSSITYRLRWTSSAASNVAIGTSTPSVVIAPDTVRLAGGESTASFTVTPQNFVGRVWLRSGWSADGSLEKITIESVQPGTVPKLDVAAVVSTQVQVVYGATIDIPVQIAARRHDGTLPTGTVALLDENGAQVAQHALDANASTAFSRSGVAPGTYAWKLRYSGDPKFNRLDIPVAVTVSGIPTETTVEAPPYFCGTTADVVVRVRNTVTAAVPTGTVQIVIDQTVLNVTLAPSGTPGEAWVTMRPTFSPNDGAIVAMYEPSTSSFAPSSDGQAIQSVNCAPFHFTAKATGTSVTARWTAQPGAHSYFVRYMETNGVWRDAGWTPGTQLTHTVPHSASVLLYAVHAVDAAGTILSYSAPDIVYTKLFTDDPVVPRATRMKSVHVTELQAAAGSLRFFVESRHLALPAASRGARIRAARILELRTAINQDRVRLGLPAWTFTDPSLGAGSAIKAVHVQELRKALE